LRLRTPFFEKSILIQKKYCIIENISNFICSKTLNFVQIDLMNYIEFFISEIAFFKFRRFFMNYRLLVLLILVFAFFVSCSDNDISTNPVVEKIDTVKIGNQVWMLKNLDVDHYRNGVQIPQVTDVSKLSTLTTGAWCYANNDPEMGKIYGKLYNWYAVNDPRGLAPEGWRIPSNSDWDNLIYFLGGEDSASCKLKEAGTTHWKTPNLGATNESGFTALPGSNDMSNPGNEGYWWTTTVENIPNQSPIYARDVHLWYNDLGVGWNWNPMYKMFSVRCIRS
jgi:uncharacterized protein (TIGR02145 family)